jgi:patatin-like phospholipase/acyl hydrolase
MPPTGLRLLSLDGGGVRGLSSLYILRDLMSRVSADAETIAKPCDYFDMIGGTSTGGLIAIMLGRLEMTVEDCIDAYKELSQAVFQSPKQFMKARNAARFIRGGEVDSKYKSEGLEEAIKKILNRANCPEDALLKNLDGKCKV